MEQDCTVLMLDAPMQLSVIHHCSSDQTKKEAEVNSFIDLSVFLFKNRIYIDALLIANYNYINFPIYIL